MITPRFLRLAATAVALSASIALSQTLTASTPDTHRFEAGTGTFLLDGKPFVVKAAELHYPRIPRPYWDQRIKMCKALGMNTICLYVFWNAHESEPGQFDFEGQNDLRAFVELCRENDMKVILRPGPYVCAEWEMGGLPWWLLRDKDIELRSLDPRFMESVDRFQKAVAGEVADLTVKDGGPIIMIQVENEYGAYGTDKPYVSAIRDMLRRNFGEDVMLFQCDWSSNFLNNGLDDLVWTLNFGTGADIGQQFAPLREARPESPLMCSEYWSGWFDKWGAGHETRPADEMIAGIDEMLSDGISFSLYMTHGGTNWGHWAGANSPGYAPDVTSYDYDAPINEWGRPTPKYHALRRVLERYSDGTPLPALPDSIPVMAIDEFELTEVAPLFDNLPAPVAESDSLRTMEEYGMGFGSMLYGTTIPPLPQGGRLTIDEVHDFARVFVDGAEAGTIDRRLGEKSIDLPATSGKAKLDVLVEATGRINFGRTIKDFKGIVGKALLEAGGTSDTLDLADGWTVHCLPDSIGFYEAMAFRPIDSITIGEDGRLPAGVYRGKFNVDKCDDTFLLFDSWGKGLVYVNGHPLGRIWEIGPQQTLYMPGCWLKKGENEILVFDILGPRRPVSAGLSSPVLDSLKPMSDDAAKSEAPDLEGLTPVAEGTLSGGNGWKRVKFDAPAEGRYLCIEILGAADGGDTAAIAELYADGTDGNRLPREGWKVAYVSSQERKGNHTAEKAFDLQESTYWTTSSTARFPQMIVIDLGATERVAGLEYLPRMEQGAPGSVGAYRIYLLP